MSSLKLKHESMVDLITVEQHPKKCIINQKQQIKKYKSTFVISDS